MPRPSNLSLELLQTFVAVVRCAGDAMKAARTLGINQPSMSKRLKGLQHAGKKKLPRPWLVRVGKTWQPTDEGKRILPAVEDVVRRLERLSDSVVAGRSPHVTFACGQEAAASFVRQAVRRFRQHRPGVRFRITTLRGRARIEGVANGFLDLATVTHSPEEIHALARRELHVEELFEDPLLLVCSEKAKWAEAFRELPTRLTARALAEFPLVLPEPDSGLRRQLERQQRGNGAGELDVALEVGGWATLLGYVRDGAGVGLLPHSVWSSRPDGLLQRALPASLAPANSVRLICRTDPDDPSKLDLTPDGLAFRDELRAAATQPGSWGR